MNIPQHEKKWFGCGYVHHILVTEKCYHTGANPNFPKN